MYCMWYSVFVFVLQLSCNYFILFDDKFFWCDVSFLDISFVGFSYWELNLRCIFFLQVFENEDLSWLLNYMQ